jgi:hypothetical protein
MVGVSVDVEEHARMACQAGEIPRRKRLLNSFQVADVEFGQRTKDDRSSFPADEDGCQALTV